MGCHCSKATGVAQPVYTGSSSTNASNTVLEHPQPPKPTGEIVEEEVPALRIAVLAVEGLRCADGIFVEVEIEGKPDSKVKTPIVSGQVKMHGLGDDARKTAEAALKCELAFKEYTEGAAIKLTVMDSDPTKTEPLGRATLPAMMIQTRFWGKLLLTGAGEGYEATLEVRVGERHILVETAQEITNALADAVEDVQEVVTDAQQELDNVVHETTHNVEKGVADCSLTEVKDSVTHCVSEVSEIAQDAMSETKGTVVHNAGKIRDVVEDAADEVVETKGAVCCSC